MRWSERRTAPRPHLRGLPHVHSEQRAPSSAVAHLILVRPMSRFFASVFVAIFCVGCATTTRERAVAIALEEVAHRKLPLPETYTVHVGELVEAVQVGPSRTFWRIDLGVPGRKQPLYSMSVDHAKSTVIDFTAYRAR